MNRAAFAAIVAPAIAFAWGAPALAQGDGPDPSPPRRVDLRQSIAIPFVASGLPVASVIPVIEVMVNGRGPFRFGIETGAGFVAISRAFADSLRLPRKGGTQDWPGFRVDSIALPGATFIDLPVTAAPRAPSGVDGVLGLPFFSELLLTLDYPGRSMRINRGELPAANGADILALGRIGPFWSIPISFGALATHAVVDTRGSSGIGIVPAFADSLRFDGAPRTIGLARGVMIPEVDVKAGVFDGDVRIGKYVFPKPMFSIRPLPPALPQAPIFGSAALQHFVVTLDQRNARLRLAREGSNVVQISGPQPVTSALVVPATPVPSSGSSEPRRLGVAFAFLGGGERIRVDMVQSGSVAEQAGLKAGDILVELDGRRVAEVSEQQLGETLRSWRPLALVVEREGRRVEVRVPGR